MADEPKVVTREELNQENARKAAREAQTTGAGRDLPIDEAPPGGKYKVGDQWVDANGEAIKASKAEGE